MFRSDMLALVIMTASHALALGEQAQRTSARDDTHELHMAALELFRVDMSPDLLALEAAFLLALRIVSVARELTPLDIRAESC